jgi:hypothetical protein
MVDFLDEGTKSRLPYHTRFLLKHFFVAGQHVVNTSLQCCIPNLGQLAISVVSMSDLSHDICYEIKKNWSQNGERCNELALYEVALNGA